MVHYRSKTARACQVQTVQAAELHDLVFKGVRAKKIAVVMAGGPAAGKSTVLHNFLSLLHRDREEFAIIDSDLMLTSLSAFKALLAQDTGKGGPSTATQDCQTTAARLNNANLEFAIKSGLNIVFDGSGRNFNWTYHTLIKSKLHDADYKVYMCIVVLDVETAVKRAKLRGLRTGRLVPEDVVRDIHKDVLENIPKYQGLAILQQLVIYDNNGKIPNVVFDSKLTPLQSARPIRSTRSVSKQK